jgi:hypothetical protein
VAVAHHADATVAELDPEQQTIARRIFLRLVQPNEGRAATRRQRRFDELRSVGEDPAQFAATLEHLATNRLLTLSGGEDAGGRTVDLAHEALIGGWPWLQHLVAERGEAIRTRQRLEDKTAEWVRLKRGRGGLLDETELAEAERWLASPDAAELGYGEDLPALVTASRLELARELQRLRRRFLAATAAAAVALVFAFAALYLRGEAEVAQARAVAEADRANGALSRALAAQAMSHLIDRYDLALLLGLKANDAKKTFEAKRAVFASLVSNSNFAGYIDRYHESVSSVAVSPDGNWVASVGCQALQDIFCARKEVRLRNLASDQSTALTIEGDAVFVNIVSFSPVGGQLATSACEQRNSGQGPRCFDGEIRLWEVASGRPAQIPPIEVPTSPVSALAFSLDGGKIASGGCAELNPGRTCGKGEIRLWDVDTGRPAQSPLIGHSDWVLNIAFTQGGKTLVSVSRDGTLLQWDIATGN